jgi:protein-S-isoprenylcysteine O-methyltransferase Ste14
MDNQPWFSPLITLLAVMLYGALHSLTASPPFKQLAARLMGKSYIRWYRLLYNIAGGLTFLPVLYLLVLYPGETLYRLDSPWLLLSLAGQMLAALLLVIGVIQTDVWSFLGLAQLQGRVERESDDLIISGLYRYVRHPLYTAGLLFIWLTPLLTTSTLALNLALTAYIYIGSRFEENRLITEFGDQYLEYMKQVPRLFPIPLRTRQ